MATVYSVFTGSFRGTRVVITYDDCGGVRSIRLRNEETAQEIKDKETKRLFLILIKRKKIELKSRGSWSTGEDWGDHMDPAYREEEETYDNRLRSDSPG